MKKAILLQLPIQGHDFFFSHENIPLAVAYLKSIISKSDWQVDLLPRNIMNYGSDQAIISFLVNYKPDIIGMSCYLWNIERNLFLAGEIKKYMPHCRIILGGPEVTPDNKFLLSNNSFDIGVVGEGEQIWSAIIQSYPEIPNIKGLILKDDKGEFHFSGENTSLISLNEKYSPFLEGILDSYLQKKVLWIESVRGCITYCSHCYYHKKYPKMRVFP